VVNRSGPCTAKWETKIKVDLTWDGLFAPARPSGQAARCCRSLDGTSAASGKAQGCQGNLLNNGILSKKAFKDHRFTWIHPALYAVAARQGEPQRLYIQNRYNWSSTSFGLQGENNECGVLHPVCAAETCVPAPSWQTLTSTSRQSVRPYGKKVADRKRRSAQRRRDPKPRQAQRLNAPPASPNRFPGPIQLQKHGNPSISHLWAVNKG